MQEHEDEPEDVRNAKPVSEEIKRGEFDEFIQRTDNSQAYKGQKPRHCCKKKKSELDPPDCRPKKEKKVEKMPDPIEFCTRDPYRRVKLELIPRHCVTKTEHQDILATPKFIRENKRMNPSRKIRTLYPRTEWLSKPMKRRILMTLIYKSSTLPTNMLDNLIQVLEDETAITPEQAENIIRDKKNMKKKAKKKAISKCQDECKSPEEESLGSGDPSVDLEAAQCQYSMAQRFVRSILNWDCVHPRDDYRDIAEVILERLSEQLEYEPCGNEDRKSEQMRILADVFACWISGILFKVAEKYSDDLAEDADELYEKCEASKKWKEEMDDDYSDEEDGYPKYLIGHCPANECDDDEDDDDDDADEEAPPAGDGASNESTDSCVDMEQQTEAKPYLDCATATPVFADNLETKDECCTADVKCTEQVAIEKIASRLCQTDVPFVTFAKIFDALYCMIGSEPDNDLCCPLDNRIHRAIYEKFEDVIRREDPKLLNERTKDVLDVVCGKLAKWLRKALSKGQTKFFIDNPAEVESREIRCWAEWIKGTTTIAENWTEWIHKIATEASCINKTGGVTRGYWQEWTSKFETNALLWRRKYLETVHQEHHNVMMMCDRAVCKTSMKRQPQYSEKIIKNTNYDSCL